MTATPKILPEAPESAVNGDALSDVLRVIRLSGAVFYRADFGAPWAAVAPPAAELARMLLPQARQMLLFHIVEHGRCWIALPGRDPLQLTAGDIVLLPYGDAHTLASDPALEPVPMSEIVKRPARGVISRIRTGRNAGERAAIICGFLHCDDLLFNPLCRGLPGFILVRTEREPPVSLLSAIVRGMMNEVAAARPGTGCLLSRLTELLFVEVLRRHMMQLPAGTVGWLGALRDPAVGRALQLIHAAPARAWTVETLARLCGTSRSLLAERFRRLVGQPVMQYLTCWRLQLAADLLRGNESGIAAVAARVGYDSEAAFNRAFKRHTGAPPAAWRVNNAPWDAAGPRRPRDKDQISA